MLKKVLWILCSSALVRAGIIETDYSPSIVSYSSTSSPIVTKTISTPIIEKTITGPIGYTKIIKTSPIYESVLSTQESKFKTPDGTLHTADSKSMDTAYSSIKKFETKYSKNSDVIASPIPAVYSTAANSPIIYHPETSYTLHTPIYHSIAPAVSKSVPIPVTYTSHAIPSYTSPDLEKTKLVTSGLTSVSSHSPIIEAQTIKATATYATAPIVSHMSFSGLGTSYAW